MEIFENIITNAIKFSERNRTVEISVVEENCKVRIKIKDHGPGLSQDDQQMLFRK
jgi:signal transduction histidine kinase